MIIISKAREMGKTTWMIEEAKKLKGYNLIVCIDRKEANRLWKEILSKGYKLPLPITFDDFIKQNYYGHNINAFLIDNADMLIQYMSRGVKIHAITIDEVNK